MTTENSFNPGDVKPAEVNFIQESNNVNEEQLDQSTPAQGKDKHETDLANQNLAPEAKPPVQANPQDSEVYKNLQAHFTKVSQDNSDLRNEVMQLRQELTEAKRQSTTPAPAPASANLEELREQAKDFEELKPFVSTIEKLQSQIDAQNSVIENTQNNINENIVMSAEEKRINTITQVHNDAIQLTNSVDFQGWLARQPAYMQSLMPGGPAREIIDLITAYKKSAGNNSETSPPDQKQKNIDAARLASAPDQQSPAPKLTTDSGKRIYSNAEIGAMSYQEYAALADDIDLAMIEGRVTM